MSLWATARHKGIKEENSRGTPWVCLVGSRSKVVSILSKSKVLLLVSLTKLEEALKKGKWVSFV